MSDSSSFKKLEQVNQDAEFFARNAQKFSEDSLSERITEEDIAEHIKSLAPKETGANVFDVQSVVDMIKEFVSQEANQALKDLFTPASTLLFVVNLARKAAGKPLLTPEECSEKYRPVFEFQKNESFLLSVRDVMSPIWEEITDKSVDAGITYINNNKDEDRFQVDEKIELLTEGAKEAAFDVINSYLHEALEIAREASGLYDYELNLNDELYLVGSLKDSVGSGIALGVEQAFEDEFEDYEEE